MALIIATKKGLLMVMHMRSMSLVALASPVLHVHGSTAICASQ